MTQHWIDIKNADVVMIIGSNAAENHPMAFKWIQKAIAKGATYINVDPRYCRSSSKAHIHAFMRSGTDIAFIGGIIKYALDDYLNRTNVKYIEECTNALYKIDPSFETCAEGDLGVFSSLNKTGGSTLFGHDVDCKYDDKGGKNSWDYQRYSAADPPPYNAPPYLGTPKLATSLTDPNCVFQLLKKQFAGYTKSAVCDITGTDEAVYDQIRQKFCETYADDKSATIMYAMGTTQHTVGTQNVRSYAILQLLMGNIGVAGGGINALRGQDNVQGSTDMCILNHILPGYIKCPTASDINLSTFISNWAAPGMETNMDPVHAYTVNGTPNVDPTSAYWWQHGEKYMVSLIKAWYPTLAYDPAGYDKLPKRASSVDYSMLSIFHEMHEGNIRAFICDGENPAVSDPDSNHVREALANLELLVKIDPFETETAAFWKPTVPGDATSDCLGIPGVATEDIDTEVYLLPCAIAYEKAGSKSNSGRWAQWHYKGVEPPGYALAPTYGALDDLTIISWLGKEIQDLYNTYSGTAPDAIKKLNWPYFNCTEALTHADPADAEKVAMEVNGYHLNPDGSIKVTVTNSTGLVKSFGALQKDGSTCSGNWLYCNQFVDATGGTGDLDTFEQANPGIFLGTVGNRCQRRYPPDVPNGGTGADPQYKNIGLHSYWSWCWPVNRRIIYNRASTYQSDVGAKVAGDPLALNKYVMRYDWVAGAWKGDVPDHGAAPGGVYPFIMHKEGHAHIFGPGRAEGPFPWHYEPVESVVANPMGNYQVNPIIHIYPGAQFTDGLAPSPEYPIAATTYRLTEHWHTGSMSRNLPYLCQLMPEPFVEMSEDLANDTTIIPTGPISNGDLVKVSCARGHITVKACVSKRFKPFELNGQTVHQVGIVWHWGYMALCQGDSGNILTPFVGDANTRIQESKAFLVKIEKV